MTPDEKVDALEQGHYYLTTCLADTLAVLKRQQDILDHQQLALEAMQEIVRQLIK